MVYKSLNVVKLLPGVRNDEVSDTTGDAMKGWCGEHKGKRGEVKSEK